MLQFLRGLLALIVFAGSLVFVVYMLGLSRVRMIESWPGLEGPSFQLTPGETGSWEPDWPPCPTYAQFSELVLLPDSISRDPGTLAVRIVTEHAKDDGFSNAHSWQWNGTPTEWTRQGIGQLPALDRPLLVREDRVVRITWTVMDVGPSLLGSSARLALRADERRLESTRPFEAILHPVFLLTLVLLTCVARFVSWRIQLRNTAIPMDSPRRRSNGRTEDALRIALRAALSGLIFACAFLAGIYFLSQWKLSRLEQWPRIHGPTFPLIAGEAGVWHPSWPPAEKEEWDWSEVRLETNAPIERPETLEVLVGIDPLVWTHHGGDWIGAPTSWMYRGIDVLPVRRASRPLMFEGTTVTRISWRVERVAASLHGSTARIVLGSPPKAVEHIDSVQADLRKLMLPVLALLSGLIFGIGWLIQARAAERIRGRSRELLQQRAPETGGTTS